MSVFYVPNFKRNISILVQRGCGDAYAHIGKIYEISATLIASIEHSLLHTLQREQCSVLAYNVVKRRSSVVPFITKRMYERLESAIAYGLRDERSGDYWKKLRETMKGEVTPRSLVRFIHLKFPNRPTYKNHFW